MNHVRNNLLNLKIKMATFRISNVMKTIFFIIIFLIFSSTQAFALVTSTPTPTTSPLQQQVDELKTRIASKVASLKLVVKKGILGTVTDVSDTQITLSNLNGKTRIIDVDELTQFSSSNSNSFGISDVKKGMFLAAIGLYNKESERTQAREIIEQDPLPNFIYGAVASIDKDNYSITVAKENGINSLVDIETITKTYAYSEGTLTKSGFSKIKVAQTILIIGYFDKQNKSTIIASRIILLPDISVSPKINLNSPPITPSTGSGKILTPIVR